MENEYWIALVSTAATLAGFTLASYSIFATRIEAAATDATCRRYGFKECTSEYSLAFMQFALNMFVVPLVIGVVVLFPTKPFNHFWHVPSGLVILLLESLLLYAIGVITRKQFSYEQMYAEYAKQLRAALTPGQSSVRDNARLVIAMIMLSVSWIVFLLNLWHLNERLATAGIKLVRVPLLAGLADGLPCSLVVAISLFVGLALVSWYFYLFEPSRVIFESGTITDNILDETRQNIKNSLIRVGRVQKWLKERVANAQAYLDTVAVHPANDETRLAKELLVEAEKYLAGMTSGVTPEEARLETRAEYHYAWLAFCRKQKVMPFREIIRIMHGIDLYVQAVVNYEQWLKEMPEQLTILINPLVPIRKRVEWRPFV